MALIDYMGSAPGFMSYSRQPSSGFTHLPIFKAPPKGVIPVKDKADDDSGLPGDAQFYDESQTAFNQGLQGVAARYGNDFNAFAKEDPEYKKLVASQKYDVLSRQSKKHNEIEMAKYDADLLNSVSTGQQPNDFALEKDPRTGLSLLKTHRIPDGKGGYNEQSGLTKGQLADVYRRLPNIDYVDKEGNMAIVPIQFDRSKGDAATTTKEWNLLLDHLGSIKTGSGSDDAYKETINGVTDFQFRNWSEGRSELNADQVNAVGRYINENGGLSESVKTDLAQRFYKKVFKEGYDFYEFDETGKPKVTKDKDNNDVYTMKNYSFDEIKNDPGLQVMMQDKFQVDAVRGYLNPKYSSDTYGKKGSAYENITPQGRTAGTGAVKEKTENFYNNWVKEGAPLSIPEGQRLATVVMNDDGSVSETKIVVKAVNEAVDAYQLKKANDSFIGKTVFDIAGKSAGFHGQFQKIGDDLAGGTIIKVNEVGQMMDNIPLSYDANTNTTVAITDPVGISNWKKFNKQMAENEANGISGAIISEAYDRAGYAKPGQKYIQVVVVPKTTNGSYTESNAKIYNSESKTFEPIVNSLMGTTYGSKDARNKGVIVDGSNYDKEFAAAQKINPFLQKSNEYFTILLTVDDDRTENMDLIDMTKEQKAVFISKRLQEQNAAKIEAANANPAARFNAAINAATGK